MTTSTHLLRQPALPAAVRHPAAQRLQRQPVQERDGAVRGLQRLQFRRGRSAVQRDRLGRVHPAVLRALRARRASSPTCATRRGSSAWSRRRDRHHDASARSGCCSPGRASLTDTLAIPLMMLALFAMGVHSTFFGPIKYAILPQHLNERRSARRHRAGRGGDLHRDPRSARSWPAGSRSKWAAAGVIVTAMIGYLTSRQVPAAPRRTSEVEPLDFHFVRSFDRAGAQHHARPRGCSYAILAISFFWTIGAVLFIQFPPLAKNVLTAEQGSRQPVPGDLLDRGGDRLGLDQRAAQGHGLGALFARLGDRDGRCSSSASTSSAAPGAPSPTAR